MTRFAALHPPYQSASAFAGSGGLDVAGERSLLQRARRLTRGEFFIGLSSGLGWLAGLLGTPMVMISGLTHRLNEFATPCRVINDPAGNGGWNDPCHRFGHKDFSWCPRRANTPRQFECTRLITAAQVLAAIRRIPGFPDRRTPPAAEPRPGSRTIC